jgi:hypothetical protein
MSREPTHRFSFLPPTTGDTLLDNASSCELKLHRLPPGLATAEGVADGDTAEDPGPELELSFELRGELQANSRTAGRLLSSIIREFSATRAGEKGGAQ